MHASVDMYATVYIIWQLQNEDFSKLFICRQTSGNKSFSLPTGGELQFLLKGQSKSLFLFANSHSKKLLQSLSMVANQFFSVSPAWKSPMDFYWFNFYLFTQFLFFYSFDFYNQLQSFLVPKLPQIWPAVAPSRWLAPVSFEMSHHSLCSFLFGAHGNVLVTPILWPGTIHFSKEPWGLLLENSI